MLNLKVILCPSPNTSADSNSLQLIAKKIGLNIFIDCNNKNSSVVFSDCNSTQDLSGSQRRSLAEADWLRLPSKKVRKSSAEGIFDAQRLKRKRGAEKYV